MERRDGAVEHLEGEDAALLAGRGVGAGEGHLLAAEVPREVAKVLADVGDAQRDELLLARAQPIVAETVQFRLARHFCSPFTCCVRVEGGGDHVVPVLPDLGADEGVDLVVPRGEVEERRVDGQVGVEGVDERPENGPTLKPGGTCKGREIE